MWIAASLAFAAVLAGALHLSFPRGAREKAVKAAALVLLLGAIGLRLGWMGKPQAAEIAWLHDEKAALQLAQSTGKPILVDFFADWCAACKELDESTFSDPTVKQTVMDRFVPLKVNGTEETDEVTRLYEKYGVPGLPTVLMMACNEPAQPQCAVPQNGPGRISGYVPPAEMIQRMQSVQ